MPTKPLLDANDKDAWWIATDRDGWIDSIMEWRITESDQNEEYLDEDALCEEMEKWSSARLKHHANIAAQNLGEVLDRDVEAWREKGEEEEVEVDLLLNSLDDMTLGER